MPTLAAVRCNPWLAAHYQRLREKGKPPRVALIAAMRKRLRSGKHGRRFTFLDGLVSWVYAALHTGP